MQRVAIGRPATGGIPLVRPRPRNQENQRSILVPHGTDLSHDFAGFLTPATRAGDLKIEKRAHAMR